MTIQAAMVVARFSAMVFRLFDDFISSGYYNQEWVKLIVRYFDEEK